MTYRLNQSRGRCSENTNFQTENRKLSLWPMKHIQSCLEPNYYTDKDTGKYSLLSVVSTEPTPSSLPRLVL